MELKFGWPIKVAVIVKLNLIVFEKMCVIFFRKMSLKLYLTYLDLFSFSIFFLSLSSFAIFIVITILHHQSRFPSYLTHVQNLQLVPQAVLVCMEYLLIQQTAAYSTLAGTVRQPNMNVHLGLRMMTTKESAFGLI